MGLPYPAGPEIEILAKDGSAQFDFPMPLCNRPGTNFSFSGLKSDVRRKIAQFETLSEKTKKDLACSFQKTVTDILLNRLDHVLKSHGPISHFVMSGGVASNLYIRSHLETFLSAHHIRFSAPPLSLCTDNGAMIAWAGLENALAGNHNDLSVAPRPRWPLSDI